MVKAVQSPALSANSYSTPEVGVGSLMERNMWFRIGPSAHDLLHFVLGHRVLPQSDIVTEKASAELVSDEHSQDRSPCDTEDHVEGNAQGSSSAHLVMSAEVVESGSSGSHATKS